MTPCPAVVTQNIISVAKFLIELYMTTDLSMIYFPLLYSRSRRRELVMLILTGTKDKRLLEGIRIYIP